MGVEYGTGILQELTMSDRTDVHLTILPAHQGQVTEIATQAGYYPNWENLLHFSKPTSRGYFAGVKYGELSFLSELAERGIPYIADKDPFDEYEGSSEYCRYTKDGELDFRNIVDSEWDTISLSKVENLLNAPIALKWYVEQRRKDLTILPWENQEVYGLKYVALQLIRPNDS